MKNILLRISLFLTIVFIGLTGFSQTRNLDNFDEVRVSEGISVTLHPSNDNRAEINMIKGELDDLVTEVKNGILHIKYKSKNMFNWGNNNRETKIDLYFKTLKSISASSGSSVLGDKEIKVDAMDLDVSSGASLILVLQSGETTVDVSSGSSLIISGESRDLNVDVSSGAKFDGKEFKANNVDVDVSSGSSAMVWATDRLVADASSGASVKYKGSPKNKNIDVGKYSGGSVSEF